MMGCNCISRVNENLKEKFGHDDIHLDTAFVFLETETIQVVNITVTYHKKKNDGTLSKTGSTMSIIPSFCPFCGEPTPKDSKGAAEQ